jgi:hypothetical protein
MFKFFSIITFITINFSHIHANGIINTLSIPDWNRIYARNGLNDFCRFNSQNKCVGLCPVTMKQCEILTNFNQQVCGCNFCMFSPITKQCFGQCSNIVLEKCVSKVPIPTSSNDCTCASCKASLKIIETTQAYNYDNGEFNYHYIGEHIPSCDESTCYLGNSCSFYYLSLNRRKINDTLYCSCNNNNFPQQIPPGRRN